MALLSRPAIAAFWLVVAFCAGAYAEGEAAAAESTEDTSTVVDGEETDETKKMLKQLTIGMISEVIDERTVMIRDAGAKAAKKTMLLRLGNVGAVPRGSLDDGEYQEKVKVAKTALEKMVDKQMIWYKVAPESFAQAPAADGPGPDTMVVDLWSIDGRHIPTALKTDGHLETAQEYEYELAKDILTAAAEIEKKESYKKLEEALKESEEAKRAAAKAAKAEQQAQEDSEVEGFGISGWLGMITLLAIVVGAATNFGRPSNKKVNLNRKKGPLEKFWMTLKGTKSS
jgi:hypothetical protein